MKNAKHETDKAGKSTVREEIALSAVVEFALVRLGMAKIKDQVWKEVRKDFGSHAGSDEEVHQDRVTTLLAVLRNRLSGYNLFGLAVGSWNDDQQLDAFTRYAAIDSLHHVLFLSPLAWGPRDAIRRPLSCDHGGRRGLVFHSS